MADFEIAVAEATEEEKRARVLRVSVSIPVLAPPPGPTRGFEPRTCWRGRIPPVALPPKKRTCNRHSDCDAADAEKRARGVQAERILDSHCSSEDCEDCFGK